MKGLYFVGSENPKIDFPESRESNFLEEEDFSEDEADTRNLRLSRLKRIRRR